MPMTSRTPSLSFEGYSVVDLYAKKSRKFQGHFCILYFFKKMFFKKWAIPGLFFSLFSSFQYTVDSKHMFNINKKFPMTGFEPRTSVIGSDRSTLPLPSRKCFNEHHWCQEVATSPTKFKTWKKFRIVLLVTICICATMGSLHPSINIIKLFGRKSRKSRFAPKLKQQK